MINKLSTFVAIDIEAEWKHKSLALFALMAWVVILYKDTLMSMVSIWSRSETFAHGFLVLPIVCWLVWRRRKQIEAQVPQPMLVSLPLVGLVALVWLLGDLAGINALTQFSFLVLVVLTVYAVLGWRVLQTILFPLAFLFFCVPFGEFLLPQLMEWTADFTVIALRISGVPVYREGLQFVIPSGNWSVVEACSGVRYLIASITVGTLFAYLNYQSTKRRILFVIVSIVVPIAANWLRAYLIVMLGHLSNNKLAAGVDHLIYGWLFFGVVIMLMFFIGARWTEAEQPERVSTPHLPRKKKGWSSLFIISCFSVLVALPHIALVFIHNQESLHVSSPLHSPVLAKDWWVSSVPRYSFKPAFHNPSDELNITYTKGDRSVGLYLGIYRNQTYDRKLISSSNVVATNSDLKWSQVSNSDYKFNVDDDVLRMRTAELRSIVPMNMGIDSRLVVWQVYWINGLLTSNDYLAKAYSAYCRLIGRGDNSATIILYTDKGQNGEAYGLLKEFWSNNYQYINYVLVEAE